MQYESPINMFENAGVADLMVGFVVERDGSMGGRARDEPAKLNA